MKTTSVVLFILLLCESFGQNPLDAEAAKIPSANNPHDAVEYLIHVEDIMPGDNQLMHALSIESLGEIQMQLSASTEPRHVFRGMRVLSYKYKQYEQQIDNGTKENIVQLLVTRAEQMPGDRALNYLKGINHPAVRSLALKYKESPEKIFRVTAEQLLRSLDETPKAIAATNSVSPTVPIGSTKDSTNHPTSVQKAESRATSPSPEESKSHWQLWAIGGILTLTVTAFLLKKRSNGTDRGHR